MKRGEFFLTRNNRMYQAVGRWGLSIVLAAVSEDTDQVLIYEPSELEELVTKGEFRILHDAQIVGGQK